MIKKFKINWTNNSIRYSNSETKAVIKALKAEPFTQGKYLERFEKKFCKYLGVQNAYAVNNCSNALDLAAMLIETKKNDEIIVPAHTWCATAISFARFGAKIIWADIDSKSLIVSIDSIKKNYSKKTKAIIVVHLYGLPANMNEIVRFAKEKNIVVIEDCAQALGASINKKKVGTFGDISVFSFHSNKIITTLGEGGMIVVNNKNFLSDIEALRHNGVKKFKDQRHYWKPAMSNIISVKQNYWPYNFCITEIQCAVGIKLIDRIDQLNKLRIFRANYFKSKLINYPELVFQSVPKNFKNVFHCLVARVTGKNSEKKRDMLINLLSRKFGIKAIVQNCPLNRYSLFKEFKTRKKLINTNNFFNNMISWPFYTYMKKKDFDYMIRSTIKSLDIVRKKTLN